MARVLWTVIAENASVDPRTNALTLSNVVDQLGVAPVPPAQQVAFPFTVPLAWQIVSVWARDRADAPEQVRARGRILGPNGQQIGEGEYDVDLVKFTRMRSFATVGALPILGPGEVTFITEQRAGNEWREVSRLSLEVVVEAAPPA